MAAVPEWQRRFEGTRTLMPKRRSRLTAATAVTLALAGVAAGVVTAQRSAADVEVATATLHDAAGAEIASVELRKSPRSAMVVTVSGRGLTPGFTASMSTRSGAATRRTS